MAPPVSSWFFARLRRLEGLFITVLTDRYVSVVVACYKDAGNVTELLRRLTLTMDGVTPNWEVIVVNDASPDNAEEVLLDLSKNEPRLTVISHARNFGAQVAFTTGMYQARGDAVVIMDGDLQDPPELVESFVARWLEGNEVVYGVRAKRHESLIRNIGYKAFYRLFNRIAYIDVPLDAGEFSLMDRAVVDVILACPERDRLIRGLRAYAGFRQTGIPFERPARFSGETTNSLLAYCLWAYKSFVSFSLAPLRLITILSFMLGIFAVCMMIANLVCYAAGVPSPRGYLSLAVLVLTIGAVNMFSLGIIGEYLGRLFVEIKGRPQPVIKLILNDHRTDPRPWLGRSQSASMVSSRR